MVRLLYRIAAGFIALAVAACSHTTNFALCEKVTEACAYNWHGGYRFDPNRDSLRDTLIVVTFSGGGTRAAALAYGTLLALQDLRIKANSSSLLDQVDIISS